MLQHILVVLFRTYNHRAHNLKQFFFFFGIYKYTCTCISSVHILDNNFREFFNFFFSKLLF